MNFDRTLSADAITDCVRLVEPTWDVVDATPAEHGHHIVYVLTLATEDGEQRAVLKATPDGKSPVCGEEARMQAILETHTGIPVPHVYGVVDEHDDLPAPFLLQSYLEGANYRGDVIRTRSRSDIERLARSTGRYLADLHSLDAVDAYGFVSIEPPETLTGRRPSNDLDQIVVTDASDSWRAYVDDSATDLVAALEDTRFADERERIEPVAEACAERVVGEFDPVVARIDSAIDNLLLDPETFEVRGMLDWEFCVAATPAYDLAFVLHSLVDGFWSMLPNTPDHRETARRSLLAGYEETGDSLAIEQFRANEAWYDLLVDLHSMLNFDDWFDLVGIDDERRDAAADELRARLRRYS
ncbi:MAG: phosphotransferase family protein [Halanaeroarchaeum sp.]